MKLCHAAAMTTADDLDAFWEALHGPTGDLLRATGIAMAQRLADRRQDVSDLSEAEIIALLHSCFLEVAPRQYAHLDQENLATSIDKMFGNISMEVAATANSSPTMQ